MKKTIFKDFLKYTSLNIIGMIGLSCYILADTFFVANALGPNGLAALNFSITVFCLISGAGLMTGIGGATEFSIMKSRNHNKEENSSFYHCVVMGGIFSIVFIFIGIFFSGKLAGFLGADSDTLPMTRTYLTTILCFAPCYILNNILVAFVRNDDNPSLSMTAMMVSSLSNIVLDYVFMYPMNMGMFGAAFATGLSPVISMSVLSLHFIKKKNCFHFKRCTLHIKRAVNILTLGFSAFIGELASSVTMLVFNLVILKLEGNIGVAAYGVVANVAFVAASIYTGISQGVQPLASKSYGGGDSENLKSLLKYAVCSSLVISLVVYVFVFTMAKGITGIFNGEKDMQLMRLSVEGLKIYFLGYFFAGINIVLCSFLSAISKASKSLIIALLRSCILLVPAVLILSNVLRMRGVWMSFVITEAVTLIIAVMVMKKGKDGII